MILTTDASYCPDAGMAGVAVHSHLTGRMIAVEVVAVPGIAQGWNRTPYLPKAA